MGFAVWSFTNGFAELWRCRRIKLPLQIWSLCSGLFTSPGHLTCYVITVFHSKKKFCALCATYKFTILTRFSRISHILAWPLISHVCNILRHQFSNFIAQLCMTRFKRDWLVSWLELLITWYHCCLPAHRDQTCQISWKIRSCHLKRWER